MSDQSHIVICGAGIAGVSAAYFLVGAGVKDALLVDERPPLSFAGDQSVECYRNMHPPLSLRVARMRSI